MQPSTIAFLRHQPITAPGIDDCNPFGIGIKVFYWRQALPSESQFGFVQATSS